MKVSPGSWRNVSGSIFLRKECTDVCPDGDMQIAANMLIMKLSRVTKIPLLLTLDSHFVPKEKKFVQDIAMQNGGEDKGMKFHTSYHMMTTEEAWKKWVSIHGDLKSCESSFQEAVENNEALVSRCSSVVLDSRFRLPEVKIPESIVVSTSTPREARIQYARGLVERYGRIPDDPIYRQRLDYEISVICDNGKIDLMSYFITLHDICRIADSVGALAGPGRGSAAACLLAYGLKITHVDPIAAKLPFERFLSQGRINRGKLPDIDMDFSDAGAVASAMKEVYGDRAVRVCTTGTNKVKGAIKDVCRVLMDTKNNKENKDLVESVCKTISDIPQGVDDLNKWLDGWFSDESGHVSGELEINETLRNFFNEHEDVNRAVRAVLGVPRSIGRHAAAYCIADEPVHQVVPICIINDEVCTQFTMGPVEKMGLVKFDILGVNTLKDIQNCINLIKERTGRSIDIYSLDTDDENVYRAFCEGRTETIFQFNGPLPTETCKSIRPSSIEDLAAVTAACRPGTLYAIMKDLDQEYTFISLWVSRRRGAVPVRYTHPSLEPILSGTHGIFIFQEQINQMFVDCCGYSPEKADELREIIGKKKADKMAEIIPDIRSRLLRNGWRDDQADSVISLCISASSYVFNRSHSFCYAYFAYACMYLKENYPLEWWTGILQNSTHKDLKANAKHFKPYLIPPSINQSDIDFYIIDDGVSRIVHPLSIIKGVKNAASVFVERRPYSSLEDFTNRVEKNIARKNVVSAMIWAGAFDEMPEAGDPSDPYWVKRVNLMNAYLKIRGEDPLAHTPSRAVVSKMESAALCIGDPDIHQMYIEAHPMTTVLPIEEVLKRRDKTKVSLVGTITSSRVIRTKTKDEEMAMCTLSNSEFYIGLTFFPEAYAEYKEHVHEDSICLIRGYVSVYDGKKSVVCNKATFFDINSI